MCREPVTPQGCRSCDALTVVGGNTRRQAFRLPLRTRLILPLCAIRRGIALLCEAQSGPGRTNRYCWPLHASLTVRDPHVEGRVGGFISDSLHFTATQCLQAGRIGFG